MSGMNQAKRPGCFGCVMYIFGGLILLGLMILAAQSLFGPRQPVDDPTASDSEACKALHEDNLRRLTRLEQTGVNTDAIVNKPLGTGRHFESFPVPCILSDQEEVKERLERFLKIKARN